jgi:hypothetical protein
VILKNLKDVSWTGAKAMMTDPGFLKSLVEFDKDGMSEKQVKRVKTEYMKEAGFTYENIKNVSTAGAGGWAWGCRATVVARHLQGTWDSSHGASAARRHAQHLNTVALPTAICMGSSLCAMHVW